MINSQIRSAGRLLIISACLVSLPASAFGKGGATRNPPGAVTFRDAGNDGSPADRIHSDYKGTYSDAVNGASVYFVANGNIKMDLTRSTRTVYLDFSTPDANANAAHGISNPPNLSGFYNVTLSNSVDTADGKCATSTGLLGMAIPQSGQPATTAASCLWADFTDSTGRSMAILFGHASYPSTTDAIATRIDAFTWTLETFSSSTAVLVINAKSGPVVQAYYLVPTKFTVVKQ